MIIAVTICFPNISDLLLYLHIVSILYRYIFAISIMFPIICFDTHTRTHTQTTHTHAHNHTHTNFQWNRHVGCVAGVGWWSDKLHGIRQFVAACGVDTTLMGRRGMCAISPGSWCTIDPPRTGDFSVRKMAQHILHHDHKY